MLKPKHKTYLLRIARLCSGFLCLGREQRTSKSRLLVVVRSLLLVVALTGVFLYTRAGTPTRVEAATSSTLNFQARLYTSAGSTVPDGNYHIEFKLHDHATNAGGAQGVCSGSCQWVETRTTGNLVTVKNGYLSVNLGSVTALPNINWDQDLWLSMNIGGSGGTASWDGEMSPRIKLTAVPYALSAGQLAKRTDASNSTTVNLAAPSGNNTITLPALTGTVALLQNAQTFSGAITFGAAGTGLAVTNNATVGGTLAVTGNTTLTGDLAVNGGDITSSGILNLTPGGAMILGVTTQTATLQGSITTITSTGVGNDIVLTTADKITLTGFNCSTAVNGGALTTDASGNLTCSDDDGGLGGSTTLQQAYGADVDGADAIIALTTADDSLVFTNPAAAGTDSGFILSLDQAAAGAVDGLRVTNAGTGVLASLDSSNATGNGVLIDVQSNSASQYGLKVTTNNAGKVALTVQGDGAVVLGSTTFQASLLLHDGNGQTTTLKAGDSAGNLSFTLPTADGSNTNCLKTNGAGVLSFSNCSNGSGSGGAVTLQDAYDASGTPAEILLATGKNLVVTSPDVATDPNILFNLQCSTCSASGGRFAIQDSGTDVFTVNPTGTIDVAGDTTVAAGKFIRITGSGTLPASPAEGTIYFNTSTGQLLVYGNGAWQNMSRSSTKVVAASNSQTPAGADYQVTSAEETAGNADSKIQSAINALPAGGGTVYLMEGTYTIDSSISIPSNVTLAGAGAGTTIKLKNSINSAFDAIVNSDTTNGNTNITLRDFKLDGNKTNQASGYQNAIAFTKVGSGSGSTAVKGANTNNLVINNFTGQGIYLLNANNNSLSSSYLGGSDIAINLESSSYNTVTGLTTQNNTSGIQLYQSNSNTITGNTSEGNATGIEVGGNSAFNAVSGNTISANSSYGIILFASHNNVSGNKFHDNGGSTANNSIYLNGSDANNITGNDITDSSCTTTCHAINISNSTSDNNYLADNRFSTSAGTATIQDLGTGTIYANQAKGANGAQLTTKIASGTDAFQIQNASGNGLFTVDTTNSEIEIGKAGASGIDGKLVIYNAANANTVTLTVGTTSASYNLVLPTTAGASGECIKNTGTAGILTFAACGSTGITTTLQDAYNNSTSPATITTTSAAKTIVLQAGVGFDSTSLLQVKSAANVAVLTVDSTNSQTILRGINSDATIGAELVQSQDFTNATYWDNSTGWTETTTSATHTTGNTTVLTATAANVTVTAGSTYQVQFQLAGNTTATDTVTPSIGGVSGPAIGQTGTNTHTVVITASTTGALTFTPTTNFNGTISAVSVKLIALSKAALTVQNSSGTAALEVRASGTTSNMFIGLQAGQANTTGTQNTALGTQVLQANTTGSNNTANGAQALQANTTGSSNTAQGYRALFSNTTGGENTAVGRSALQNNTTGNNNTASGFQALLSNTTGSSNTALGSSALFLSTTGSNNTAVGSSALSSNTTGANNTVLGSAAFNSNTTGSQNTILGNNAGYSDSNFFTLNNLSFSTALGYGSQVQQSNALILGGQGSNAVNVGIGTTMPANLLSISPVQYSTGTAGTGGASSTTVTGSGTTWTADMIGSEIIFANGSAATAPIKRTITAVASATSLTIDSAATVANGTAYRIHRPALQVTSGGNLGLGIAAPTSQLHVVAQSALTNGQTQVQQTLTVANATASGIVRANKLDVTVANTTAGSTYGHDITVTDNTNLSNVNTGLKVTVNGSNVSQSQVGIDSSANLGTAIRGISDNYATDSKCANAGAASVGVCGDAPGGALSVGVYGRGKGGSSSTLAGKNTAGVVGYNDAAGIAGNFYAGIKAFSVQTGAAAYTSLGLYSSASGAAGSTVYGGYFTLDSGAGATLGSALYASNSTVAANILQLQDNTTDVLKVADGGLLTMNPAANLTAGQTHITQTLTNGAASGTVIGYNQTLTVAPSAAATTQGIKLALTDATAFDNTNTAIDLTITDNGASGTKSNTGLKVTLAGSSNSQKQIGVRSNVANGTGLMGVTSGGASGGVSCGDSGTAYSAPVGVCGGNTSTGTLGMGVFGTTRTESNAGLSANSYVAGVVGHSLAAGTASNTYIGVQGYSNQTTAAGYNSVGVFGGAKASTGATVYGGYFTIDAASTATLGSALYATNGSETVNILQLQDNTTNVLQVADGGLITMNPAASLTNGQIHLTQNVTAANATASGVVTANDLNLTVSNTTAGTTYGHDITVTDNTALANTNVGLKVTMAGSNTSQSQIGIEATVSLGVALKGISSGQESGASCGGSGSLGAGVCGFGNNNDGTGVYGESAGKSGLIGAAQGTGVYGVNYSAGTDGAGTFYAGLKGRSSQTAAVAYTSSGVYGEARGGAGATTYGGYFTFMSTSTATLGSALYASNSTVAANILQLQDNTTDVLRVADGGSIYFGAPSALAANLLFHNATNANTVTLKSGVTSTSYDLTFPLAVGATGECLKLGTVSGTSGPLTFGSCGAGSSTTLQQAYDNDANSTEAIIALNSTDGSLLIRDASTPLSTAFAIQDNAGTANLLSVASTGVNIGVDTTIAAQKTLRLIGGTTAQRPGSPSEGQIYFDTDTDKLLVYSNGKWQADRTAATKIVAANNSAQAIKDAADYVADGTGDQTEINAALTAAAGGKVYLAEGTYVANATILVPNNTTLAGAGRGTLIELADLDATDNLIENSDTVTGTGIIIQNLRIDGRKDLNGAGVQYGIHLNSMGDGVGTNARQGAKLTNLWVSRFRNYGIRLNNSDNNTITGNTSQGNDVYGISIESSSNNAVTGNTTQGNGGSGIILMSSSNNAVTGNTAEGNVEGIFLFSSSNNAVTGNTTQGNDYGIRLGSSSLTNTVSGNKAHDNGAAIFNNGIYIDASDNNTITGNDITDTSCTSSCHAINIVNSTSDNNYLADNRFSTSSGTATINDAGTGTVYANQSRAANGGQLTVRTANNTAAFQIQNATGASLLNISSDTSAAAVQVTATAGGSHEALTVSNSTSTGNIARFIDGTTPTDVLTIANGGFITMQPAASLTNGQIHVTQNVTAANATASGVVTANDLNLTVSNTTAGTTYGHDITVTDNTSSILNTNVGLKVTMAGSNTSQTQYGVDASVSKGVGLRGVSTGMGTANACATTGTAESIGVCAISTGVNGVGLMARTDQGGTLTNSYGTAINAFNDATGTASQTYVGIKAFSNQSGNAAYTSVGIRGIARGGTGATTYGGYFTFDSSSTATLGSALYASNSTVAANILQLQDNTTDVLTVANGGAIIVRNETNSTTALQVQNSSNANIFTVDTSTTSNLITNGGFEGGTTTGWTAKGTATLTQSSSHQYQGNNSLSVAASTGTDDGALYTITMTNSQQYTFSFYAKVASGSITDINIGHRNTSGGADNDCLTSQTFTTSWTRFTCTFTATSPDATGYVYINKTGGSSETFFIDGVQLQTGATTTAFDPGGQLQLAGVVNSPLALRNKQDSTTAFQIQNAAGTDTIFTADTTNLRLHVGSTTSNATGISLVLDSSTAAPTGVKGAMYYDSTNNKFKCFGGAGAGSWVDCDTIGAGGGQTRKIYIVPEYAGGIITADGSSNNGTMTSDYDSTNRHTYYQWVNSTGALNDYDIVAQNQIPSDYASGFGTFKIWVYADSTSTANNDIQVTVRDNAGTACASSVSVLPGTAATWTEQTVTLSGCSFAANDIITVSIRTFSKSSNNVRVGKISYQYTN